MVSKIKYLFLICMRFCSVSCSSEHDQSNLRKRNLGYSSHRYHDDDYSSRSRYHDNDDDYHDKRDCDDSSDDFTVQSKNNVLNLNCRDLSRSEYIFACTWAEVRREVSMKHILHCFSGFEHCIIPVNLKLYLEIIVSFQ